MKSTWEKPAPGVTQASTHMHPAHTSVHMGNPGSQTGNGADIGDFTAHQHTMPDVHFNKPQHDSEFVGTREHGFGPGESGSKTAHGADRGSHPA